MSAPSAECEWHSNAAGKTSSPPARDEEADGAFPGRGLRWKVPVADDSGNQAIAGNGRHAALTERGLAL
jgi:hypothetical protein